VAGLDLPAGFDAEDGTGVPGVRDLPALVDIAAKGEKHVEAGPPTTVASLAGLLVYEIADRRPFDVGLNYRAAMRTLRYTARLNRWTDDLSDDDWDVLLRDVASGSMTEEQLGNVVASFLRPRSLRAM
jgi:hypothetical protein